jgi:hypothetical protein
MNRRFLFAPVVAMCACLCVTITGLAQGPSPQTIERVEKICKELKLTPKQKAELIPVFRTEAPQIEAIKSNPSLSGPKKIQQLRAVHAQTDPQMRAILSPQQYERLQAIREREIQQIIRKKLGV